MAVGRKGEFKFSGLSFLLFNCIAEYHIIPGTVALTPLCLSGYRVDAGRYAKASCSGHEEHIAGEGGSNGMSEHSGRAHGHIVGIPCLVGSDILAHPVGPKLGILFEFLTLFLGEFLKECLAVGSESFHEYAGRNNVFKVVTCRVG